MGEIREFRGKYRFLSNFWPTEVVLDDIIYPSVENAYQAAKTQDINLRFKICGLTPGEAKKFSRTFSTRNDWEKIKIETMEYLIRQKFRSPKLKNELLLTEDKELIEGNYWHDNFWGRCYCSRCKNRKGLNILGRILMKIRGELRNQKP